MIFWGAYALILLAGAICTVAGALLLGVGL